VNGSDDPKRAFESADEALSVLSDRSDPLWGEAFQFLLDHPRTAELMRESFRATLAQLGVDPSGVDPDTGEPIYGLREVAGTLGMSEADLESAPKEPKPGDS
jgi:hypothetical protein